MLQITITGERASGKTILAILLAQFLEREGFEVLYEGGKYLDEDRVRRHIAYGIKPVLGDFPKEITIVDRYLKEGS